MKVASCVPNFDIFNQQAFHIWKSSNYPVQLPPLPVRYPSFTAATGSRRAQHPVTVHKSPAQARVSLLPPQSAKATVLVTVNGRRRGAE